jgi:hypothetical protein
MKKLIAALLAFMISLLLFACGQKNETETTTTTQITETTAQSPNENEGIGGDEKTPVPEFLDFTTGSIPNMFWNLARETRGLNPDANPDDISAVIEMHNSFHEYFYDTRGNRENLQEMGLMVMVQYFGISREAFDRANAEWAQSIIERGDSAEPYNADVIFTFDNALIQEYYRCPQFIAYQNTMQMHNGDRQAFLDLIHEEDPVMIAAVVQAQQAQTRARQRTGRRAQQIIAEQAAAQ